MASPTTRTRARSNRLFRSFMGCPRGSGEAQRLFDEAAQGMPDENVRLLNSRRGGTGNHDGYVAKSTQRSAVSSQEPDRANARRTSTVRRPDHVPRVSGSRDRKQAIAS